MSFYLVLIIYVHPLQSPSSRLSLQVLSLSKQSTVLMSVQEKQNGKNVVPIVSNISKGISFAACIFPNSKPSKNMT